MCDYCSDRRNIEPAHSIALRDGNGDLDPFIEDARNNKKFLAIIYMGGTLEGFMLVDECPRCGYVFTESDYDNSELIY